MANHQLPMPGEKPGTIWQPRPRARFGWLRLYPAWVLRAAPLVLTALGLALALWAWRATATQVTVVVNGHPVAVRTHRSTVAGAVRLARVSVDQTVYVDPPEETALQEGMLVIVGSAYPVLVHADGQILTAHTRETNPETIAASLGIVLGPYDAIRINRAVRPSPADRAANPALGELPPIPREITVVRAKQLTVTEVDVLSGAQTIAQFPSTAQTVGEALSDVGYLIYVADEITPPYDSRLPDDGAITVQRSIPVTLVADGRTLPTRTRQTSVEGFLQEHDLALTGFDYSVPPPGARLSPDLTVTLVRVTTEDVIEESPIPFETVYVPDPDLVLDQQRVIQDGIEGRRAQRIRVRREDGLVVSRAVHDEWVSQPARARVIAYGTQIVIRTVDTPYGPLHYWRKLHVLATSYSPLTAGSKQPGDPFFGLSATGAPVVRGIVASDPRVIGLGTNLFVPGYGTGRALDVGGAVKGFRIDLGYDDANLVLWNTWVDVYLVIPVPPSDEMIWVLPGN